MNPTARPTLVDTDIATDPDDLLALLFIAASPELELRAVTTTYGDTHLRARIARQVCNELGIAPSIAAGPTTPISGRPIWYAGNEQRQLDPDTPDEADPFPDAVATILELSHACQGELHIIAIGPLTNIALAVQADPTLPERVQRLAVMGGDFGDPDRAEHNLRCDADAARIVFDAGFTTRIVGVDQTRCHPVTEALVQRWIDDQSTHLQRRVARDVDWWHEYNQSTDTLVHDPLAAAMLTHPELFDFETSAWTVDTETATAGRVVPSGAHSIETVRHVDERALSLIVERIAASVRR